MRLQYATIYYYVSLCIHPSNAYVSQWRGIKSNQESESVLVVQDWNVNDLDGLYYKGRAWLNEFPYYHISFGYNFVWEYYLKLLEQI
jgi:hypothetical protein